MDQHKLAVFIEQICQSGCTVVNATIHAMEAGQDIRLAENLTEHEKQFILEELKSIMAVYNKK